jgi:hypothetical protein
MDQFWDSTPRELINAYRGRYRETERNDRESWERTRWQTAVLLSPHTKNGVKIRDLITFPWEKKPGGLTKEQRLERLKKL